VRRHETDWLSLSLGGLFLVVAAMHIGDGDGAGGTDGLKWVIPGVLLVLGVLGVIGAVRGGRTPAGAPAGSPATPAAPSPDEPTVRLGTQVTVRLDRETDGEVDREPDIADPESSVRVDEGDEPQR
jgi:hypothetical protein